MNETNKIPLQTKLAYGVGSVSSGVKDTSFNVFLLFFYTQVVGLSGTLAGAAIFTALILDALSDPLVGYWSDRFKSRWGRRHPFIYFAALPMGVSFYFLFNPPHGSEESMLFIWMLTWAVLVRFFMTFFSVPSGALTAEMTSNYDERTSLSSFRVLMGWFGGLTLAIVAYSVFFAPTEAFEDGRLNPAGYENFALMGAVMIVAAILICAVGTHHLIPKLKRVSERSHESLGLRQDFRNILGNKPFLILVAMIFAAAAAFGFSEVISLYMFTYFWGLTSSELALLVMPAAFGTILAFAMIPKISRAYDKRPVAMAAVCVLMALYPLMIVLRLLGLMPENGSVALLILLCVNSVITVFAAVTMMTLFVSMIADTVDLNQLLTGRRQEAIYTSAYTLSLKATSGLGGLTAGIALDIIRFPTEVDVSEISADAVYSLGASVAVTLICLWCLTLMILKRYPLTRAEHAKILEQLEEGSDFSTSKPTLLAE